jgi:hypothetical protein
MKFCRYIDIFKLKRLVFIKILVSQGIFCNVRKTINEIILAYGVSAAGLFAINIKASLHEKQKERVKYKSGGGGYNKTRNSAYEKLLQSSTSCHTCENFLAAQ